MNEAQLVDKLKNLSGRSIQDTADAMGLPRSTVIRYLKKYGLYRCKSSAGRKKEIWTQYKIEELKNYESGDYYHLSAEDKAKKLGVSIDAYYAARREYILDAIGSEEKKREL